jgi:photosystem II stability/assembly factor-like uncharacterized protein
MLRNMKNTEAPLKNRVNLNAGIKGRRYQERRIKVDRWCASLLLLSFFSGILLSSICLASNEENYTVTRRDKAFSVHFIDEKCGWIVGDKGLTLKTVDGGENWQRVKVSEGTLNDIFFIEEKGWIVGGGGMILHTDDGGKNWKRQMGSAPQLSAKAGIPMDETCSSVEGPLNSLMKVCFMDKDRGVTVGADGTILRTENSGSSWERAAFDSMEILPEELIMNGIITLNLYDVFFLNENSGWIVGDSGTILHSEDGGKEWAVKNIGLLPPLFSISFKNDIEGWAVGQNGFSLKTEDGGKTWEKVVFEKENSLYEIRISGDYGAIVGDQATIIKTNDGGKTWGKVNTDLHPPYPWLADAWIFPSNSAKVLSVGKGVILKTSIDSR